MASADATLAAIILADSIVWFGEETIGDLGIAGKGWCDQINIRALTRKIAAIVRLVHTKQRGALA